MIVLITLGLLVIAVIAFIVSLNNDGFGGFVAIAIAVIFAIFTVSAPIIYADSARKAHYYNSQLNTSYTAYDFMLYSDEIEKVEIPSKIRLEK